MVFMLGGFPWPVGRKEHSPRGRGDLNTSKCVWSLQMERGFTCAWFWQDLLEVNTACLVTLC